MTCRRSAFWAILLPLIALGVSSASAQSSTDSATTPAPVPKEYTPEEFPDWALTIRRAEILALGALPITSLFAGLGFDYVYYATHLSQSGIVPWPLGPGTSGWTEASNSADLAAKNLTIVATSVGLAVAIAAGDWLLGILVPKDAP